MQFEGDTNSIWFECQIMQELLNLGKKSYCNKFVLLTIRAHLHMANNLPKNS